MSVFDTLIELGQSATPGTVVFRELSGSRRRILLRGRALPYQAVEFPIEMRTKIQWYAGNPEATQQVLGPSLPPTEFNGMWKLRFLTGSIDASGLFLDTVEDVVELFYDIVRSGNKLSFEWGSETREGIMTRFTPDWDRPQDCRWNIRMEWSKRAGEGLPRGAPFGIDFLSDIRAALNGVQEILALRPLDVVDTYQRQVNATFAEVAETSVAIDNATRRIQNIAAIPGRVLGEVANNTERLVRSITTLLELVTELPITAQTTTLITTGLFTQELNRRNAALQLAELRQSAIRSNQQVQRQAVPRESVRLVTAPAGASFYWLSVQYYGTPDFARFLQRLNKVDSLSIPPGIQLQVPPRPAALVDNC